MTSATSSLYMATVAPGLESVAESEMVAKLRGAWTYATFRGRLLFGCEAAIDELQGLRCVDNLFAHIAWFEIGPHRAELEKLRRVVAGLDLSPALAHLPPGLRNPRVTVSASRSGRHNYNRFEAAEAVMEALLARPGFRRGDPLGYDVAFRLDLLDDQALLSVKLTPPDFRFRVKGRRFSRGALRPTVAHCLIWISSPTPDQVFLDPFCGSGTLALERAAYRARRIVASDISAEAVAVARRNFEAQGATAIRIEQWDARSLPLDAGSVSTIVTNPPWGEQIRAGEDMLRLYRAFLKEAKRVLKPGGTIFVLTDRHREVATASKALGLSCHRLYTLSLHGLVPGLYQIR